MGVTVDRDIVHQESSPPTSEDDPLVKDLIKAVETVVGHPPRPQGIGGGTVAAFPRKKGYPAAVWATLLGNAHQPDEHTSIRSILQDAKVMTLLCL
jgi:succinyl-diaminopimelate desuccinylase